MRREFHFSEGTSNKFWAIELAGAQFTVQFGKLGTAGQTQTKSFGSEAEALKQSQKLIAEKTGKGYREVGSSAPVAKTAPPAEPAAPTPAPAAPAPPSVPPAAAKAAPAVAPAPPPAPPPPVAAAAPRKSTIDLDPIDWFWKTDPRPPALPRPVASPFDLASCLDRLRQGLQKANLSPGMDRQEAVFWMTAIERMALGMDRDQAAADLAKAGTLQRSWDPGSVVAALKTKNLFMLSDRPEQIALVLDRLLGPVGFLEAVIELPARSPFLTAIRTLVLPYWTDAEVAAMQAWLEPKLPAYAWPSDFYALSPMAWQLAAMLGMHESIRGMVSVWPDKLYGDPSWDHSHYHIPQPVVLALGDPERMLAEFRRLRLTIHQPPFLLGWLAAAGLYALEFPRDCILAIKSRPDAEPLVEALGLARAPELAPIMLELKQSSKAPRPASQWLEDNLEQAVAGLLETANGRGRLADHAVEFLRKARKKGVPIVLPGPMERVQRDVVDWVEPHYPPFDAHNTPAWLQEKPPAGKLPAWVDLDNLPPLVVGDFCLNPDQRQAVLLSLSKAGLDSPPPLLTELRSQASETSRTAFVWSLLEAWLGDGAPSKERWALAACGLLGGDEVALRLVPMIRKWPGESQHQRAVFGLECLRAIGTDTALMGLNGMAQKLEFKALKAKAMECMEGIASQRKMTRAQLEDRIVPDCGLDERGSRVFDYGSRQFRFVLGEGMKPMVQDAENRLKSDPPAPTAKDDAELAKASLEAWKLLKKQIRDVAKVQAERLEQAMVTGRRWTVQEFQTLLVGHPLMINLVRLLIWGSYDSQGQLRSTFRIDEESQVADCQDQRATLPEDAQVGVAHPLHLSAEEKAAWGTVFADYQLIAPFAQLGRPCYQLAAAERGQKLLTRYAERKIAAATLVGTLEKRGWARGVPQDGGVFCEHSKPFYGAQVTAVAAYEGVPVGYMVDWDDQSVEYCYFVEGIRAPDTYPDRGEAIPLDSVDPVALSEVLADLEALNEKAR